MGTPCLDDGTPWAQRGADTRYVASVNRVFAENPAVMLVVMFRAPMGSQGRDSWPLQRPARRAIRPAVLGPVNQGPKLDLEAVSTAFFVAFKLPNLLRRLFAEGAFSQAFVPILGEYKNKRGDEATRCLVDHVASILFLVLFAVSLIIGLARGGRPPLT